MKLLGHCQGIVKLKFNPNVLNYSSSEGGIYTYGSQNENLFFFRYKMMTNITECDPYFDDEDVS